MSGLNARIFLRSTLVAGLLLCSAIAHADFQLTFTDPQGSNSIMRVKDGKAVMSNEDTDVLVEAGSATITSIDHRQKQYMVMDESMSNQLAQQRNQMQGQMEAMRKQMAAQLATMPPEQRAMMEKMMRGHMPAENAPKRQTVQPGGTAQVGKWKCRLVTLVTNGQPEQELCVVDPNVLGMSRADYKTLVSAMETMHKVAGKFSGRSSGIGPNLADVGGVPVQMKQLNGGSISRLQSYSDAGLSPGAFQVPAGYQQHQMFKQ